MRVNFYVTDAYGGFGGIAQFNRNFCEAILEADPKAEIKVMPLHISEDFKSPDRISVKQTFANKSKINYLLKSFITSFQNVDITICGHINLLPTCALSNSPLVLLIYGVEVWKEVPKR